MKIKFKLYLGLDAIMFKFQLKNKEFLKIWSTIRTSLNGKGRALKYQYQKLNR
jgi:hypothetical protein